MSPSHANVHSPFPTRAGERELAETLAALPDPQVHLWFGIDHLPGVGDIDVLLWHEGVGVFVIEGKPVPLSMVEYCDLVQMKISGRPMQRSASWQAFKAMQSLMSFLSGERPVLASTACFPFIARGDWRELVSGDPVLVDVAERLLFREDLGDPAVFAARLKLIRERPPHGQGWKAMPPGLRLFDGFTRQLRVSVHDELTTSERERLKLLHKKARRDEAPTQAGVSRIAFVGHPGTGKTIQLVRIAIQHSAAGKRVLMLCFNKALGADLKRLLSGGLRDSRRIDVYDLYELLKEIRSAAQLPYLDGNQSADEGAVQIIEHLRSNPIAPYDTVVIDEGQDVPFWTRSLVDLLTTPESSILTAFGRGQQLYGDSEGSLLELGLVRRELRRNFRNTRLLFRFAQTFFECGLRPERIPAVIARFSRPDDDEALLFEREMGHPIKIATVDGLFDTQREERLSSLLRAAVEDLRRSKADPIQLLILVPDEKGREHQMVIRTLEDLGCEFNDYADRSKRRTIPRRSAVRVSTFHSARGLEADRVLVFGFTRLRSVAHGGDAMAANLAYVVLSRAARRCSIFFDSSDAQHEIKLLTEQIATAVLDSREALTASSLRQLRQGADVQHPLFGRGLVLAVASDDGNPTAQVYFESGATVVMGVRDEQLEPVGRIGNDE